MKHLLELQAAVSLPLKDPLDQELRQKLPSRTDLEPVQRTPMFVVLSQPPHIFALMLFHP